jgi:hypothetical protein
VIVDAMREAPRSIRGQSEIEDRATFPEHGAWRERRAATETDDLPAVVDAICFAVSARRGPQVDHHAVFPQKRVKREGIDEADADNLVPIVDRVR